MHTRVRSPLRLAHLVLGALPVALLLLAACGGGGGGGGLGCFNAGVVTLTGTAPVVANPSAINVCQGGTVHFQNNTGAPVQIDSNGACSEIDMTTPLAAGAASTAVAMPTLGTCSYHTSGDPSTAVGTITVITVPVGGGY
ncbi:MAG TPA: hypothetical protein VFP50_02290 [Anaeromyxobacteraceae bacterium]|nr:hypothetical protein [Anaeromyxobacteraceae bacterium]